MPLMRNKFGDEVNIPDNQIQTALNSGYTYVSQPQNRVLPAVQPAIQPSASTSQTTTVLNQQTGLLEKVPVQNKPTSSDPLVGRLEAGETVRVDPGYAGLNSLRAAGYIVEAMPGSTQGVLIVRKAPAQQPQLPESTESLLDVLQNYLTSKPADNFKINPDLNVTEADMAKFLSQAKQELQPYYGQLFQQTAKDLQTGLSQISEDVGTSERQLETQANQQLGNLQESFAQRGLTFSSKREEGEKSLIDTTRSAIEEGRKQAQRRSLEAGTVAERTLGSQNLPQIPGIESAPEPIIRPGQLVFSRTSLTRPLFSAAGGVSGSLERDKLLAETGRQRELKNIELEQRGLYTK